MGQQLPQPVPTPLDMPQQQPAGPGQNPDDIFSAQQVQAMLDARARELQQAADARLSEQSKQFSALNDELARLREFQAQQQAAEEDKRRAIEEEQRRKDEEELSAKQLLTKYRQESETQLRKLQEELAARDALLVKERELQAIRDHASRRVMEEGDNIMPQFHDYITVAATSLEAVERNIEIAKNKTAAIVEDVRQAGIRRQSGLQPVSAGSGSYDYPGVASGGQASYTAEQIAGMTPGSPEHLAARQALAGLGGHPAQHVDASGFPTDPRMTLFG